MLQDIRTVNRKIHAYYPELPLILMGHSMGSLAVRAFVAEHDSCADMLDRVGSPATILPCRWELPLQRQRKQSLIETQK